MKNVMGIIRYIQDNNSMEELTRHRCMASVPYGGKYRLIDFTLSNMVNSGINNIGVMTNFRLRSLIDHLGRGKEWGLDRKRDGLFILPTVRTLDADNNRQVDLEDIHANIDYLQNSKQKYVLITGSNIICNIDFQNVILMHQEQSSDITLVYKRMILPVHNKAILVELNGSNRITQIKAQTKSNRIANYVLDMYLIEKKLLLDLMNNVCIKHNKWDLVNDIIKERLNKLKVYGYRHKGYASVIHSLNEYYSQQMELLAPQIWEELFFSHGKIITKAFDGPPVKYHYMSDVKNSLLANGCEIEGTVENCILSPGVIIKKGAVVKNCIIMDDCEVSEKALLDRVIIDKNVHIRKGMKITGNKDLPEVIAKKRII